MTTDRMTDTQDRLEERLRELDLVIEQLRNEGYHDWPDILTRTRAALRQSQDIKAAARALSDYIENEHITYDDGERGQLTKWPAAIRLSELEDALRAALAPKAEERCPTCGSVDPERIARGWNTGVEPWVRCDDRWHAPKAEEAPR